MMQTLNKMKEKLEKETNEHKNVKQQVAELTARLHELSTVCCPFGGCLTVQLNKNSVLFIRIYILFCSQLLLEDVKHLNVFVC